MDFQYPSYFYRATIVRVIDGDTIDVDLDVGFDTTLRKRLRFLDIDTFEVRGEEKEKGLVAKARLEALIEKAEKIYVQTVMDAEGKYGRVLAWVWGVYEGSPVNLNQILLEEGHGTAA